MDIKRLSNEQDFLAKVISLLKDSSPSPTKILISTNMSQQWVFDQIITRLTGINTNQQSYFDSKEFGVLMNGYGRLAQASLNFAFSVEFSELRQMKDIDSFEVILYFNKDG